MPSPTHTTRPWSIRRQVVWTPRGRTCGPRTRHARRSSCKLLCRVTQARTSTSSGITWRMPHQPGWRHPGVQTARSPTARCWLSTAAARPPRCWRGVSGPQAGYPPSPIAAALARLVVRGSDRPPWLERSSDEYKVMAMASYGEPVHLDQFRRLVYPTPDGGFHTEPVDWASFALSAGRVTGSPRATPTWRPASKQCSKKSCWSCATGCTAAPEAVGWPWRVASP